MARILVVDDSVTLRQMVVHVLRQFGHEIHEASCAEDALTLLRNVVPELLLTDLHMPGLDGIALAERVRAIPAHHSTPILVLSTDSSQEVKERGRARGVTGWISKPFDPEMLQGVVQKVLP